MVIRPLKGEDPRDKDDFEKLIHRFNRMVAQLGILREVRLKVGFEPASVKRRRKQIEVRKRKK